MAVLGLMSHQPACLPVTPLRRVYSNNYGKMHRMREEQYFFDPPQYYSEPKFLSVDLTPIEVGPVSPLLSTPHPSPTQCFFRVLDNTVLVLGLESERIPLNSVRTLAVRKSQCPTQTIGRWFCGDGVADARLRKGLWFWGLAHRNIHKTAGGVCTSNSLHSVWTSNRFPHPSRPDDLC